MRDTKSKVQIKFNTGVNMNSELGSSLDGGTLGNGVASFRQTTMNNPSILP